MKNRKYRNRDWLYQEYYKNERSITDIAEQLDVDHTTISKWRRRLDIPKPNRQIEMKCSVCGSEFSRIKSKVERVKYTNVCSRECLYEGRSKGIIDREVEDGYNVQETVIEKECPCCGKGFKTTLSEDYKHCSRSCFLSKHSDRMSSKGNPMYKDGSSKEKRSYRGPDWNKIRKEVYKRDNYICQKCGVKCIGRDKLSDENSHRLIQAHHIEKYECPEDNVKENLVTLCVSCHASIHQGESDEMD